MILSGTDFEKLVKPFFETILKEIGFTGIEVRNQNSGTQDGFDIHASFVDTKGNNRNLFIECKNYTTKLEWSEVFKKQMQLHDAYKKIDGLILVSPKEDLSNVDHRIQSNADVNYFKFPCQFWTPNSQIRDIFAIDDELYKKVYGSAYSGTLNHEELLKHVKGLIDKLFNEKDNPAKSLPPKEQYSIPPEYISRRVTHDTDKMNFFYDRGESLEVELKKEQRIALIGWAGTGKSTELEHLANKLAAEDSLYYPFLRKLNTHTDKAIKDYIPNVDVIPSNLIVLILDGLDEVQSGSFDTVSRKIQQFCNDYKESRVIVSCRSNFYSTVLENSNHNTLRGFKSLYLSDLSYKDTHNYLTKKLGTKKDAFEEEVERKQLLSLISIPYYLIKLAGQYLKHNRVADSKAALFEEVITESIAEDVDRYFRESKTLSSKKMRTALEKLAFLLEYQGKNYCTWEEIAVAFNDDEQNILKCAGTLLYGSDEANSIWKFNHNNIQEYLVAKVLSKLDFSVVREIITFRPENKKVKPTWVNTLSFLITILGINSTDREGLLKMLIKNEPELIVKFEPDKLDEIVRFRVFKEIFLYYKDKGRWINRNKYNYRELARFSMTKLTLKFLLEQSGPDQPKISVVSSLDLIAHYNLKKEFPEFILDVKRIIEYHLFNNSFDDRYVIIRSYFELFKLSSEEFKKVIDTFSKENNTWIRYTLYYGIHQQGFQDEYIDYLLDRIKKAINREHEDDNRLTNEDSELKECISLLRTKQAIEKTLNFILSEYGKISYSPYYKSILERTLINITENYFSDEQLFLKVKDAFAIDAVSIHGEDIERFLTYFDKTNTRVRVFKEIYNAEKPDLKFYTLHKLAILANEDCIDFLAGEFSLGYINKEKVDTFQYQLSRKDPLLKRFNDLVNKKELIPLPVYRDIEKERELRNQETLILLFDKNKFKSAIEQVFIDAGKDELNYDEIFEIHKTEWQGKYLQIVYDSTRIYDKDKVRNRIELLDCIEKNWQEYSIRKLFYFLKNNNGINLSSEQIALVKGWCDEKLNKFNFKTALTHPNPNSTVADRLAVKVSYFIRKLNINTYENSVYLDLLSFVKWDDKESEIFDFVEEFVPKSLIEERVIQNIVNGISYHMVLENHLKYCQKYNMTQITTYLVQYLEVKDYQRYHVLDCFLKLKGDLKLLHELLPKIKDDFRFEVIKKLLQNGYTKIESFILESFNSESDSINKLNLANSLIQLQNLAGVEYYIEYIEKNQKAPDFMHHHSPFDKLTNIKALNGLFKLFELGFDPRIKRDKFENLENIARGAIEAVSLSNENYEKCIKKFKWYKLKFKLGQLLRIHNKPEKVIIHLDHYFEEIERKYFINKSSKVSLKEALEIFRSISG